MPSRAGLFSMDIEPYPLGYGDLDMDDITGNNLGDVNMDSLGIGASSRRELAIFNSLHGISTFTSDERMDATITTGDYEHKRRAMVRGIRPAYSGDGAVSVQVGGRFTASGAVNYGAARPVNGNGVSPQRVGGRYHRALFFLSGEVDELAGFDHKVGPMGER
jgi:hypothetical protein